MDGFLRIARLTTIIADGVRMALGKASTEGGGLTVIGAVPTKVGRVPTKVPKPEFCPQCGLPHTNQASPELFLTNVAG